MENEYAYHRLRCGNDIIGAARTLGWGCAEPEPGKPMPPLECVFPAKNEDRMRGKLEVWLFRVGSGQDLFREEWIGEITIGPDHPCRRTASRGQTYLELSIHLDGHEPRG